MTTTGGPGIQTTNLPYQIFLEAFSRQNVGRASAYGIFAIVLANILVTIFLRVIRNQTQEEVPAWTYSVKKFGVMFYLPLRCYLPS